MNIKRVLRESGRGDIVEDIEDEFYGMFDDLKNLFRREGFTFHGEQLTHFVWVFCALIRDG